MENVTEISATAQASIEWSYLIRDIMLYAIGAIGLIANGVVIGLSIVLESLKGKEYRIFIINHSIITLSFALNSLLVQNHVRGFVMVCKFTGFITIANAFCIMQAPTVILLNRYVSVCFPEYYDLMFNRKTMIIYCLYPYVISYASTVFILIDTTLGLDSYGLFCTDTIGGESLNYVSLTHFLLAYGPIVFFSVYLVKNIRELERVQQNLNLQKKIRETRFLTKASMLQAGSPLILQSPLVILLLSPPPDNLETATWVNLMVCLLFVVGCAIDPMITLIVVNPYRRAVINRLRSLFGGNSVSPA